MMRLRLLLLTISLTGAGLLCAQTEAVPGIRIVRGTFVPGAQPDGNTVLFTAPDGLIALDTGRYVQHTTALFDAAASLELPIIAVVNSHWHLDHIGGNELVRKAYPGVTIYASDALAAARKGFLANYRGQLEEVLKTTASEDEKAKYRTEIGLIDAAPRLAPDVVIASSGSRTFAGRDLYVGLEHAAVTAGDVWLFDQKTGVLASGDLVTLPAPFLDTACAPHWLQSLDTLHKTGFELLIPGHGPPLTHKQFDMYRTAFRALLQCAASDAAKTVCADGWLLGITPLIPASEQAFTRSLMNYYVDVLRRPEAERAKLCATETPQETASQKASS